MTKEEVKQKITTKMHEYRWKLIIIFFGVKMFSVYKTNKKRVVLYWGEYFIM